MPTRRAPALRCRSVLCPVDFSGHSRAALRYAGAVATKLGARLTVLFVDDPLLDAAAAAAYDQNVLARATQIELRRFVATSLPKTTAGAVRYVTAVGKPGREIDKVARRLRVDLIVMGTQGLSGPRRLVFGSTTDYILRRTQTPVLAVPARRGAGR